MFSPAVYFCLSHLRQILDSSCRVFSWEPSLTENREILSLSSHMSEPFLCGFLVPPVLDFCLQLKPKASLFDRYCRSSITLFSLRVVRVSLEAHRSMVHKKHFWEVGCCFPAFLLAFCCWVSILQFLPSFLPPFGCPLSLGHQLGYRHTPHGC